MGQSEATARSSLRFRIYEAIAGWALLRMAEIAAKRLDLHELEHIAKQMEVGESVDCGHVRELTSRGQSDC